MNARLRRRWSLMTRCSVARSIGIAGSTAMTSHSDSDMVQLLQLQGVEPGGDPGGPDDLGQRCVVEQARTQRGGQHREMLAVPGRVVAQEAELVIVQTQA